jgi:alkylation response protein AidB-like acyl-CoA dehydrogenase
MLTARRQGGGFLFEGIDPGDVVVPDDLPTELEQIASTARDFVDREVLPAIEQLEAHDWLTSRRLLRQAGELGFGGLEIPAAHGGLGLNKLTATVVAEALGASASFAVTFMVQTGIGSLPIVYFGTPEQKERYLPSIATGERVAAYSLTEPGSGSDALGARTTARLSADGKSYLLNGTKQWTSNAGFADVFVVFAKIDSEQFSAFLVDRTASGVSIGAEERKMGLHGSSTAQVILTDAVVPLENLLHFAGRGHQVAFNMLNLGRFKLGAVCAGAGRYLLGVTTNYVRDRRQFGRPLVDFPLVRQKLAGMAVRTYTTEAMVYRIAGLLDDTLGDIDLAGDVRERVAPLLAEFAIECSIAKVHASETLHAVVDEGVQLHGGYGFMEGYAVERAYRDSRINRIFEGTNEINRLLIPQTLLRRIQKGDYGPAGRALRSSGTATPSSTRPGPLAGEWAVVDSARDTFWKLANAAVKRFGTGVEDEQEVLAAAADVAIETFAMESALARAEQAQTSAAPKLAALHLDLARVYVADGSRRLAGPAQRAFTYLAGQTGGSRSDANASQPSATGFDTIAAERRIAAEIVEAGGWPLPG